MERLVHALGDLRRAFPETPVRVIVNRVRRSALGPDATGQIRETLRRHVGIGDAVCVPEDREACDAALRAGGTLAEVAPRSQVRNALRELVTEWTWPAPLDIAA
jgi:Flp pilus assembly CpaE family ATPase